MLTDAQNLSPEEATKQILGYCTEPHGRMAILEHIHVPLTSDNYDKYIKKLVDDKLIASDLLVVRSANKQIFVTTRKGLTFLGNISA